MHRSHRGVCGAGCCLRVLGVRARSPRRGALTPRRIALGGGGPKRAQGADATGAKVPGATRRAVVLVPRRGHAAQFRARALQAHRGVARGCVRAHGTRPAKPRARVVELPARARRARPLRRVKGLQRGTLGARLPRCIVHGPVGGTLLALDTAAGVLQVAPGGTGGAVEHARAARGGRGLVAVARPAPGCIRVRLVRTGRAVGARGFVRRGRKGARRAGLACSRRGDARAGRARAPRILARERRCAVGDDGDRVQRGRLRQPTDARGRILARRVLARALVVGKRDAALCAVARAPEVPELGLVGVEGPDGRVHARRLVCVQLGHGHLVLGCEMQARAEPRVARPGRRRGAAIHGARCKRPAYAGPAARHHALERHAGAVEHQLHPRAARARGG